MTIQTVYLVVRLTGEQTNLNGVHPQRVLLGIQRGCSEQKQPEKPSF